MDVITDGSGNFSEDMPGGAESAIYEAERPYGPFTCAKCGAEYEELDGQDPSFVPSSVPDCGKIKGGFVKTKDFFRDGDKERFQFWTGKYYDISVLLTSSDIPIVQVTQHPNEDVRFLPELYVRKDWDNCLPSKIEIQTASYGAIPLGDLQEFVSKMGIALQAAKEIDELFIQPLREKAFDFGEFIPEEAREEICEATFVSVWDGGTQIETRCKVNQQTKEVFDIEISQGTAALVYVLDREFVRFEDGTECPVYLAEDGGDYYYEPVEE